MLGVPAIVLHEAHEQGLLGCGVPLRDDIFLLISTVEQALQLVARKPRPGAGLKDGLDVPIVGLPKKRSDAFGSLAPKITIGQTPQRVGGRPKLPVVVAPSHGRNVRGGSKVPIISVCSAFAAALADKPGHSSGGTPEHHFTYLRK
jgi:hypothetical protein